MAIKKKINRKKIKNDVYFLKMLPGSLVQVYWITHKRVKFRKENPSTWWENGK